MIELKNIEWSYRTGHTETWVLRRVGLTIVKENSSPSWVRQGQGSRRC